MPFIRALVVEDLDEPRQWLVELLPRALPSLLIVDAAPNLERARTLVREQRYDIVLLDWHLPDGTSESLITETVATHPGAAVIVATIHDDDTHVFPALRAGATGYILKSQPDAAVISQLQRIEMGEPALSPSIALRMLRHFSPVTPAAQPPGNAANAHVRLTDREADVLRLIAKGYSAPEVAALLGLTPSTVSSYIRDIYRKLGITSRAEAAMEAARRGWVT